MEKPMAQAWRDESGRKWVRLQARTDVQLAPLGLLAMDALDVRLGERVLDVGCGAGATLVELAGRVGPTGSVVGVDISEPLLERARVHVRESGAANVEFVCADAATQRFDRGFDAVFSRFGVMFFDDPLGAFHNLRATLRSGGRLGFVCWQSAEGNPWASEPLAAVRAVAPEQPLPELLAPGGPGPFAFADAELVRSLLERAGFTSIQVSAHHSELHLGGAQSLAEAVDFLLDIGPAARFAAEADPVLLPRFREALLESVAPYASPRGIWVPGRTWVVTASNA